MTLLLIPALLLMVIAGYYIFVPADVRNSRKNIRRLKRWAHFLTDILLYTIPMLVVYALVHLQDIAASAVGIPAGQNYARYIMILEGDSVSLIQELATPLLTYVSGFFYLLMFPFLIVFTFLLLLYLQRYRATQEFVVAFILIYMFAFPFFVLFPVHVTGYTLACVTPLLYNLSPIIAHGVRIVDPTLNNCFPSLHAALSMMAMLVVLHNVESRRYRIFSIVTTATILFTILYLGIHWITDLVGGILLAVICCFVAFRYSDSLFGSYRSLIARISYYLRKPSVPCVNCNSRIKMKSDLSCPNCGMSYGSTMKMSSFVERFRKFFT
ncbi:membrane-associated phospholipid phosphatase [Methanohalophilus levihalophilus]|uniref:phosphatase PAP2 family protein n=1 Tax=Methanohalophilus levihalophilus TaxID=1431282 RepID=UPI001AE7C8AC|nr:phosphatase PAP2 family protein [Methanohalophilus levihalophilus]MBP2030124.1 membrane-associated phospholipid phosphatase [Methanohalophilus levihalophilus]